MQANQSPVVKEEDHWKRSYFYCLNPFCPDNENRKFENEDRHFVQQKCKKWIIHEQLLNNKPEPINVKDINNIAVDYQNHPLTTYDILNRLKVSNWQKVLDQQEKKVKKEVNRAIEIQFQTIKIKIQQIISSFAMFDSLYTKLAASQEPNPFIEQFYNQHTKQLRQMKNRILFNKSNLKQAIDGIKQNVKHLFNSIVEDQQTSQALLSHEQQRDFHQFMFQQTQIQPFSKLQKLFCALRQKQCKFNLESQKISLECPLCLRQVKEHISPTIKKAMKKKLAQKMISHLYSNHYDEVGFAYCRNISKSFVSDLKFEQFLTISKKCKQITIIDRQSGVAFEHKLQDWKSGSLNYTVEIISIKNAAMARGKHILVHNHHSIDSLIAILSYICTQRDQNVEIMTKKTGLKNAIEDLLCCRSPKTEP